MRLGPRSLPARRAVAAVAFRLYVRPMTARWFTDDAKDAPAAIRPVFTGLETTSFNDILAFAQGSTVHRNELMRCLDAAGTLLHAESTGHCEAPLTDEMKDAIVAGGGVRLWHNHPTQDSLSHHDWFSAGASPDVEILALNERGSIFVGRIVDWDDRLHSVFPKLPPLAGHLDLHMDHRAAIAGVDPSLRAELRKFTGHILNCALADCATVRYAYCLTPLDDAVMRAGALQEFIDDGRDFAAREIDKLLASAPPPDDEDGEHPAGPEGI